MLLLVVQDVLKYNEWSNVEKEEKSTGYGRFSGGYNAEVKLSLFNPSTSLQPIMQTYDSFNALATASATPLTSDMSTFNASSAELRTLSKALNQACQNLVRLLIDIDLDNYPDLHKQVGDIANMLDEAGQNAHAAFLREM